MAATATRSKRDVLEEHVLDLQAKRDGLLAKVVDLAEAEDAARLDALRADPGKRPSDGGIKSDVFKIRQEREKAEREIGTLEADLRAAVLILAEFQATDLHVQREGLLGQAAALDSQEEKLLARFGERLGDLLNDWHDWCEFQQSRLDALVDVRITDDGLAKEVRAAFGPALTPTPLDLAALLELVHEAAVDPDTRGYREGHTRIARGGDIVTIRGDALKLYGLLPNLHDHARYAPRYSGSIPFFATNVKAETATNEPVKRYGRTATGGLTEIPPATAAIRTAVGSDA